MSCVSVSHQWRARHYPPHSHGEYQMIFVCDGKVRLNAAGRIYNVSAPAILLLGNLETHSFQCITDVYERYTVTISPKDAAGIIDETLLAAFLPHGGRGCVIEIPSDSLPLYSALFAMLEEEAAPDGYPGAAELLVQAILIRLYRNSPASFPRQSGGMNDVIASVRRTLEENLDEKISLADLGERFHVSVYHLERLFRTETGYPIGRYRLMCRIAAAREMLAASDIPIGEIAARVGIGDTSNFSRCFRRETGLSPIAYRKKYREERRPACEDIPV